MKIDPAKDHRRNECRFEGTRVLSTNDGHMGMFHNRKWNTKELCFDSKNKDEK